MGSPSTTPRRRADAVRNRARVVDAAARVFAEKGLEGGVPEIAARAGVGKGTVYRCFPTKEHLIAAVVVERLQWIERRADELAAAGEDPWEAFAELMLETAERHVADHAIAQSIALDPRLPELQQARAATLSAVDRLIRRAQDQGAMRRDVTSADVRVLLGGIASVLEREGERDLAAWRRYVGLMLDGLRAERASRLPSAPRRLR